MLNWRIINQKRFRPGKNDCDYKFSEGTYYGTVDYASFMAKLSEWGIQIENVE